MPGLEITHLLSTPKSITTDLLSTVIGISFEALWYLCGELFRVPPWQVPDTGQGQANGLLGRNLTLGWDKGGGFSHDYDFRLGQSRLRHPDHP